MYESPLWKWPYNSWGHALTWNFSILQTRVSTFLPMPFQAGSSSAAAALILWSNSEPTAATTEDEKIVVAATQHLVSFTYSKPNWNLSMILSLLTCCSMNVFFQRIKQWFVPRYCSTNSQMGSHMYRYEAEKWCLWVVDDALFLILAGFWILHLLVPNCWRKKLP